MKLFGIALVLGLALLTSVVAGAFSVVGLATLFAGTFWSVTVMAGVLEAAKIAAAAWLHANWTNPGVSRLLRAYLVAAVAVLMLLTALGTFGFLSKGFLEQQAPVAAVQLQVDQIERRITFATAERDRLLVQVNQADQSVQAALTQAHDAKAAARAAALRDRLKKERASLQQAIGQKDREINALTAEVTPLKASTADLSAKLGPVRYVAEAFGWTDPNSAVRLIIALIMFAFDPLAIALVLSGTISLRDWLDERQAARLGPALGLGDFGSPLGPPGDPPPDDSPPHPDHIPHSGMISEHSVLTQTLDGEFVWKTPDPTAIPVHVFGDDLLSIAPEPPAAPPAAEPPAPAPVESSPVPAPPRPSQEVVPVAPALVILPEPEPAPAPAPILLPAPKPEPVPVPPTPPVLSPDAMDEPMEAKPPGTHHAGWLGEPWFSQKSK